MVVVGVVGAGSYDLVWRAGCNRQPVLLRRNVVMPDPPQPIELGDIVLPEPHRLRVIVTTPSGARVPGAVVRLDRPDREMAVRADQDGEAVLSIADPIHLLLEADAPNGSRGAVAVPVDALESAVVIQVAP